MNNKLIILTLFIGIFLLMSFASDRNRKKKVIFFGDSITQMGVEPGGYITKMQEILNQDGISNYDLVGSGVSGNKIYDLYFRMDSDVISQSPDIVVIFIGVNDVWHKASFGTGTDPDKFELFYRAIIRKLQAAHSKVMLVTPLSIGEKKDCTNQQDGDLNKYCNIIKSIGSDMGIPVCDLRSFFNTYEEKHNPKNADRGILTLDGVHLNGTGSREVAEQIWEILKTL